VTEVRPSSGSTAGGTKVLVLGYGMWGASGVTVGGVPATSFKFIDAATLELVTPPGTAGWQDVKVIMPGGQISATFQYVDAAAAPVGASAPAAATVQLANPPAVAPGKKASSAPSVKASAGQVVNVKVTGLPKKQLVTVRAQINGAWVVLGKVRTSGAGAATLPPFLAATAGTYPVQITDAKGKKSYVNVVVG
jgi:hypothetical protein